MEIRKISCRSLRSPTYAEHNTYAQLNFLFSDVRVALVVVAR